MVLNVVLFFATEAWAAVAASCCESALRDDFLKHRSRLLKVDLLFFAEA